MDFYNRQESLGLDTDKVIVVIGAGGIGMNAALQLAMAGTRKLLVFDDDTIETHNLNRLPVPAAFIGKNKAETTATFIGQMRPEEEDGSVDVKHFPFKFNPDVIDMDEVTNILDCTDVHEAQLANQAIADEHKIKYFKAGYDGMSISINDRVGEWDTGETPDGYQITPSYCVPAIVIAGLAVHKILTNSDVEMGCQVKDLFVR
jgi:molybdopterin/thiamine biosynthesis adenylyltransferase